MLIFSNTLPTLMKMSSGQVPASRRDRTFKPLQGRLEKKTLQQAPSPAQQPRPLIAFNCCLMRLRSHAFILSMSLHFTSVKEDKKNQHKTLKIIFRCRNTHSTVEPAVPGGEGKVPTPEQHPQPIWGHWGVGRLLDPPRAAASENGAMAPCQTTADSTATLQDPPS